MNQTERINYLDGLRGVAIFLVVLFHAYAHWANIVPYGTTFAGGIAKYGWLGVELFFMISGFVIYMTLEKCNSFYEFILRRWLRLFPAMLLVSLLIFLSAGLLQERPAGRPVVTDLIPGILFIEPLWISKLFGINQGVLEGAFWSLFVEMKFYIFFGSIYFLFKSNFAKIALFVSFVVSIVALVFAKYFGNTIEIFNCINTFVNKYLSFNFFGWFLIGVLTYDLYQHKSSLRLILLLALGCIVSVFSSIPDGHLHDFTICWAIALICLFVASIYIKELREILSTRLLVFMGFISYPFYLFHENFMIACIIKIGKACSWFPGILMPIIPFFAVCIISYFIAKYLEPYLRRYLKKSLRFILTTIFHFRNNIVS